MNTTAAFMMGEANRHKELMVFDWSEAAWLIKKHNAVHASAGLHGDWEYTGDSIYNNGSPILDTDAYLASTWATPEIEIDGDVYD